MVFIICEKCGETVDKLNYDQHSKIHKEKRVETCPMCFKKFTNISNFKYHMSHHSEERPWICDECPKTYKTKTDLIQHQRVHDKSKEPLVCEICNENFKIRSKYNVHLRNHFVKKGPQKCDICKKNFVNLQSHIKQVHEQIKRHKCSICSKEFGKKYGLLRHISTVHEKIKSWSCDFCQKAFGEKAQLLRHHKTHLNEFQIEAESAEQDDNQVEDGESANSKIIEEIYLVPLEEHQENDTKMEIDETSKKIKMLNELGVEVLDEYRDLLDNELLNIYRCEICCFTFKQKRYYQAHMKTVHSERNEKSIECNYCDERFTHRTQRLRHIRQNHPEVYEDNTVSSSENQENKLNRTCKLCHKVFTKVKYLELHAASAHNIVIQHFECDFCSRQFSFKSSLERHIKSKHLDLREYFCQELSCERAFRSRYELNEHFKKIHLKVKSLEICDICDKRFTSSKSLYTHKKIRHEKVSWKTNYICKICFEKFDTKYKKIKHHHQVHQNGKAMYRVCHYCSNSFQHHTDFIDHIKSHRGCFICEICGLNFKEHSSLFIHKESHKRIEEEFRQFICDICSHRLSNKAQLIIHMRKHSNESHYVCEECGKSYKFYAPFLHHQLVHKNKYDYSCSICSKAFRKLRDKQEHEKVHSGIRPYKCDICYRTFTLKHNYSQHMKIHQRKNFECKYCKIQLNSSAKCRQHEMSEHANEFQYKCFNCSKIFKTIQTLEKHKCKGVENLFC